MSRKTNVIAGIRYVCEHEKMYVKNPIDLGIEHKKFLRGGPDRHIAPALEPGILAPICSITILGLDRFFLFLKLLLLRIIHVYSLLFAD